MFPTYANLNSFYGNPDGNGDGQPDARWEAENLTTIVPPYPMRWSWNLRPVTGIRLHKKCAPQFRMALVDIANGYTQEQREALQLDLCGGAYTFRVMRGGHRLSVHSWGAAIDLAPERNFLGRRWDERQGMMPKRVVDMFRRHGIRWGGLWPRPDAMHFEATTEG